MTSPTPRRRLDIALSDEVINELRALGRPERTGGTRSIGAKHFAAAYVRAVHELVGPAVDTTGLHPADEEACVERVKAALLQRLLRAPRW